MKVHLHCRHHGPSDILVTRKLSFESNVEICNAPTACVSNIGDFGGLLGDLLLQYQEVTYFELTQQQGLLGNQSSPAIAGAGTFLVTSGGNHRLESLRRFLASRLGSGFSEEARHFQPFAADSQNTSIWYFPPYSICSADVNRWIRSILGRRERELSGFVDADGFVRGAFTQLKLELGWIDQACDSIGCRGRAMGSFSLSSLVRKDSPESEKIGMWASGNHKVSVHLHDACNETTLTGQGMGSVSLWSTWLNRPIGCSTELPCQQVNVKKDIVNTRASVQEVRLHVTVDDLCTTDVMLRLVEPIPVLYTLLLHTFRYEIRDAARRILQSGLVVDSSSFLLTESRANTITSLSWNASLPPGGSLAATVQIQQAFLPREWHLPAASRGVFVPPTAVMTLSSFSSSNRIPLASNVFFSETPLYPTVIPDFSMPFNVITLVSTVLAFLFGSIVNAILRRLPKKCA